ncbi:MAG TPA: hypothetical protein VFW12_10130 [Candidatus Limnocylindria bacterium]|nr:hypothetical protein [Candidatus Limnocylindria bacterium]
MKIVAGVIAFVGAALGCFGLLLLAAVASVFLQGKPPDLLSTVIGLVLVALAAFALRAAWQQWRRGP